MVVRKGSPTRWQSGWIEREVYGKVRYMSASGLERKA